MFTSDNTNKRAWRTCIGFGGAAGFFVLFGAVYEVFSHQVYSNFMIFAFLIPLLGGALPFFLAAKMGWALPPGAVTQLYGGGIMALTLGSVMRGVLDIYGTTNSKLIVYPAAGVLMLAAALAAGVIWRMKNTGHRETGIRESGWGKQDEDSYR